MPVFVSDERPAVTSKGFGTLIADLRLRLRVSVAETRSN